MDYYKIPFLLNYGYQGLTQNGTLVDTEAKKWTFKYRKLAKRRVMMQFIRHEDHATYEIVASYDPAPFVPSAGFRVRGNPGFATFIMWTPTNSGVHYSFIPGELTLPMYALREKEEPFTKPSDREPCYYVPLDNELIKFDQLGDYPGVHIFGPGAKNTANLLGNVISWDPTNLLAHWGQSWTTPAIDSPGDHFGEMTARLKIWTGDQEPMIVNGAINWPTAEGVKYWCVGLPTWPRGEGGIQVPPNNEMGYGFVRSPHTPFGRIKLEKAMMAMGLQEYDTFANTVGLANAEDWFVVNNFDDDKPASGVYAEMQMSGNNWPIGGRCPKGTKLSETIATDNNDSPSDTESIAFETSSEDMVQCLDCDIDECEASSCNYECKFYVSVDGESWSDVDKSKTLCVDESKCPCNLSVSHKRAYRECAMEPAIVVEFELSGGESSGIFAEYINAGDVDDVDDVSSVSDVRMRCRKL